jgi:hypothetical protein
MLDQRFRARIAAGVLVLLSFIPRLTPACAATPTEYELKAVLVFKLGSYIRWPNQASDPARQVFVIGILGKDPFGPVMDRVVDGERLAGRPVVVRRLTDASSAVQCDILYISASERPNIRRTLDLLRAAPVLTVADMNEFAELGGMINLKNDQRRIRFEINVSAVERAGLKAASQLVALARVVEDGPKRP